MNTKEIGVTEYGLLSKKTKAKPTHEEIVKAAEEVCDKTLKYGLEFNMMIHIISGDIVRAVLEVKGNRLPHPSGYTKAQAKIYAKYFNVTAKKTFIVA